MSEFLVLVDEQDRVIGSMEKLTTHLQGLLHRAFSIVVFNEAGQILIQRRADGKYHSAGLWSNTCCGHPRPNETTDSAARRRLHEEMGFDCDLTHIGSFRYLAHLDNGLVEHEIDHVFVGTFDGPVLPNPAEVGAWEWVEVQHLGRRLLESPREYTYWFRKIWDIYSATFSSVASGGANDAR